MPGTSDTSPGVQTFSSQPLGAAATWRGGSAYAGHVAAALPIPRLRQILLQSKLPSKSCVAPQWRGFALCSRRSSPLRLLSVSSPSPLRLLSVSSPSSLLHPTAGWRKDDRNLHRTRTPRCELDSAAQATKFSSVAAGLCRLNDAPAKVAVHEKISAADQCVLCWHDCAWCFDGADGEKTAHKARH